MNDNIDVVVVDDDGNDETDRKEKRRGRKEWDKLQVKILSADESLDSWEGRNRLNWIR